MTAKNHQIFQEEVNEMLNGGVLSQVSFEFYFTGGLKEEQGW